MSAAAVASRRMANVKHGAYAATTATRLRQRRLRDRVRRLRKEFPQLEAASRTLILRYAELEVLSAALWNHAFEQGPVGDDGHVRRAVIEYRHLAVELRS